MSQRDRRPVPRLDLAPKLKRPLSLWNPLDYLRLLYWVFFFPQALRWYVQEFCGGFIHPEEMTFQKGLELLRQHSIQRQLLLKGLMLVVIIPVALGAIFQGLGFPLNWFGVAVGVAVGLVWSMVLGIRKGIVQGVVLGVGWGVLLGTLWVFSATENTGLLEIFGILGFVFIFISSLSSLFVYYITWLMKAGVKDNLPLGAVVLLLGLLAGVVFSVIGGIDGGLKGSSVTLLGMTWKAEQGLGGVALGMVSGWVSGLAFSIWFGLVWAVTTFRPENWLLGLPLTLVKPHKRRWLLPHVTPLPFPAINTRLRNWLQQDWETGIHNANQLLAYTFQFTTVISTVNRVLAKTPPELVIARVAQLAEAPYDWNLVRFASASLKSLNILQGRISETRLDTPARAAAAGFWHLHQGELNQAAEAFTVVSSLPYGEEMFILAQTLLAFSRDGRIAAIDAPQMPIPPLLRPATWKAIAGLHQVVEDIRVVERSVSRSTRSFALNRALGELTDILKEAHRLPEAERQSIAQITNSWREALLQVAGQMGTISITEPICNPYVVGDPVEGDLFVGREDVLSQLEELWVMGHQLQSIVLYGHRRMGKTSILKNAANCLGGSLKVVYVNLLSLGNISQGVGEMLMAISDEIARAVNIPSPDDAELLNLPYRTFERYLKQVDAQLGEKGLIIALDEFEQIEEFIAAGQIHQHFIKFLRGLVQMSSKVAFVFAGLHTLEEMTEDYFHPFFASIIPIHVGFLTPESTRQLLANPTEEFLLDFTPEALDRIYALIAGQPYLIQLVGFWLVRRYNNQVFEQRSRRDPVFTVEDVEAVINDPKFYKQGRYYFTGVWSQAEQGAYGQQAILKAIAPHPEGLSMDALAQAAEMEEEALHKALETLKRHDVIEETEGCWHIIVELFRRWVYQQHC